MNIAIIGSGYVGLVAGTCFADTGNDVVCVDVNADKIAALNRGEIPIYEPGLAELLANNIEEGRLKFSTDLDGSVRSSDVIFIAVGTPQGADGSADLRYVLQVAEGIGKAINHPECVGVKVIVDKSTVPVGTAKKVAEAIARQTKKPFHVVSNPEFLKEGSAIDDFMKPDRVVVGVDSEEAAKVMRDLYEPFVRTNNPVLVMDITSAEMTKYAANAMLAARISFMNEISQLCEKTGADIDWVRIGIGTDSRIGMSFLFPGIGYGGSCFPKDVQALIRTGQEFGVPMSMGDATEAVNERQKELLFDKIKHFYSSRGGLTGRHFAMWGLAFKPKTDDVREAPALVVCNRLLEEGATITAYDPEANGTFQKLFGEREGMTYATSNYDALVDADALLICTEWNEFRRPNFSKLKDALSAAIIFDGRNIFEPARMSERGFHYHCIGRPSVAPKLDKTIKSGNHKHALPETAHQGDASYA